jgi:hypothetical protein
MTERQLLSDPPTGRFNLLAASLWNALSAHCVPVTSCSVIMILVYDIVAE